MVNLGYMFLLLKASYIAESVIGELENSPFRKATYMHFHHIYLTILVWVGANFHPGGYISLVLFINTFVHILTDGNYLLTDLFGSAFSSRTRPFRKAVMFIVVSL
jgi:GNS1/SUR4 family